MTADRGERNVLSGRIGSIDAFRGFIMFLMLVGTFGLEKVGYFPAAEFLHTQLSHADWVGFHFEDLILPAFLFIIGVSMELSDRKRRARGDSVRARFAHMAGRTALLFGLGFLLSWIGAGKPWLGPGVLQVLALSSLAAWPALGLGVRGRFVVFGLLLFAYWFFIFIVAVPEAGRNSYVLFKNLVYLIDNRITGSTTRWGYLYPTLTQAAVVVFGSIIGKLLAERRGSRDFARLILMIGTAGILLGLTLHPAVPIIKRMFTPSYTLLTCGLASLLFLGFHRLIDLRGAARWGFPFTVIGVNSIFIYLLNGLLSPWLMTTAGVFLGPVGPYAGDWMLPLQHTARLAAEWGICFWLWKHEIFFKL
jgi:heparan-alpha-glucosaminide N-acetyltransferase